RGGCGVGPRLVPVRGLSRVRRDDEFRGVLAAGAETRTVLTNLGTATVAQATTCGSVSYPVAIVTPPAPTTPIEERKKDRPQILRASPIRSDDRGRSNHVLPVRRFLRDVEGDVDRQRSTVPVTHREIDGKCGRATRTQES